ncbi:hypothetical protein [Secundilactobacillus folii]|uniref:Uncharacterized protein n=1 Tax=Secundilactobacillus folii TaxID=2678357 RepID=A0A7X3C3N4_9LACO|nr:hypothetical protein [Secundilactobacillus folii]MTV82484.1 hypothetical protein [Secundilactobacillus folii]
MKQLIVELFVLLLTILLFLIGMTQFHQPAKTRSSLPAPVSGKASNNEYYTYEYKI